MQLRSLRAMTWNLWWQFGPWAQRQPAIAAELARVEPDVVFIQEVFARDGVDQAEVLAEGLGYNQVRTREANGEPQEFGNAILSRWPLAELETVRLPGWDGADSHRTALAARIESPAGPILGVVTHLSWQYDASALRLQQLRTVVDLVRRYDERGHNGPTMFGDKTETLAPLLAGDFNAVPDSDEIRKLTGLAAPYVDGLTFTDSWAAVGDGDGYTWNRANPHAAQASWPRRRIDYLFVGWPREKPLMGPTEAWLAGVEPQGETESSKIVPSDHYAVVAELALK